HLTFDQRDAANPREALGQIAGHALETRATASREDDRLHAPPIDGSSVRIRAAPWETFERKKRRSSTVSPKAKNTATYTRPPATRLAATMGSESLTSGRVATR